MREGSRRAQARLLPVFSQPPVSPLAAALRSLCLLYQLSHALTALAADPLVELGTVSLLGCLAAFPPDRLVELGTVPSLCRSSPFAAGFANRHRSLVGHLLLTSHIPISMNQDL